MIFKSFFCKILLKYVFMFVLIKYKWFLKKKIYKNKLFYNRCLFSINGFINIVIIYKIFLDFFFSLKKIFFSLRRCY